METRVGQTQAAQHTENTHPDSSTEQLMPDYSVILQKTVMSNINI
jgi:hypothetical protein